MGIFAEVRGNLLPRFYPKRIDARRWGVWDDDARDWVPQYSTRTHSAARRRAAAMNNR